MIAQWLEASLILIQIPLGVFVGYLLFLTLAGLKADRKTNRLRQQPEIRFLILIPAHNEEASLPGLLENLSRISYPPSLLSVYVIADNCSDRTVDAALNGGAKVYTRINPALLGKGYALNWGFQQALQDGLVFDAVVILDADTILSPQFLKIMDAHLALGERVVQGYYSVRNSEGSWTEAIRFAAFTVLHYLRPQARMALGFSVGIKGNGIVFKREILEHHEWSGSITEDIELHMNLILAGERVTFAPDAVLWGEMPNTLSGSQTQHSRWERGRVDMARKYGLPLLVAAWEAGKGRDFRRAFLLLDALMEHLIPPFAVLLTLSLICTFLSILFFLVSPTAFELSKFNLFFCFLVFLGEGIYLLGGLRTAGASKRIYLSLLYVPLYLVWKIKQYVLVLFSHEKPGWIRTARNRR